MTPRPTPGRRTRLVGRWEARRRCRRSEGAQGVKNTLMVASFDPLQKRRLGIARCAGSQASDVIHLVCPEHAHHQRATASLHSCFAAGARLAHLCSCPLARRWPDSRARCCRPCRRWQEPAHRGPTRGTAPSSCGPAVLRAVSAQRSRKGGVQGRWRPGEHHLARVAGRLCGQVP